MASRRDFVVAATTTVAATVVPSPLRARSLAARSASAGRLDPRRLQALLDEAARALGVVGAQLAVFDGQAMREVATGLANRDRALAVTTDTLFQIGSTTKVFNAALIMTLVDDGTLDLDRPVKTWIRDFKLADPDATERVTLRQLLSMSAGLDNGPYQDHGRGDDALSRYVASLADIPQVFEPGTAFGYSNAGSNVAGLAAQRAAGKNWETLLAERILRPLGLRQSANFAEDLLFHPVSLGYMHRSGPTDLVRVAVWGLPRSMAPAGGLLCCSAGDLVRMARMFLSGGKAANGSQVVSAARIETMHTPQVTLPTRVTAQKWCTGPYWKQWGGETIYGHSGTNSGGSSMLLWCPAKNIAIATIANVPRQGYPLADRIFDTVFPEMFGITKPATPRPDTVTPVEVDLRRYAGKFEAFGTRFEFADENGRLVVRVGDSAARSAGQPGLTSELIPLGDDRFLPANPALGGNRGWDVAFWGKDAAGRATHYLNGVFALRRSD
jgi:CubicO group peptidase (beta-lactamase class C family)